MSAENSRQVRKSVATSVPQGSRELQLADLFWFKDTSENNDSSAARKASFANKTSTSNLDFALTFFFQSRKTNVCNDVFPNWVAQTRWKKDALRLFSIGDTAANPVESSREGHKERSEKQILCSGRGSEDCGLFRTYAVSVTRYHSCEATMSNTCNFLSLWVLAICQFVNLPDMPSYCCPHGSEMCVCDRWSGRCSLQGCQEQAGDVDGLRPGHPSVWTFASGDGSLSRLSLRKDGSFTPFPCVFLTLYRNSTGVCCCWKLFIDQEVTTTQAWLAYPICTGVCTFAVRVKHCEVCSQMGSLSTRPS